MVRGVTRQVVLMEPEDKSVFEKAIFLLKEDCRPESREELLRQARELAAGRCSLGRREWGWNLLFLLAGASGTGAIWLLTALLGG